MHYTYRKGREENQKEALKMLNDRDKKYEGQDDSEYHFSEDEVSYEVESEPKPTADSTAAPSTNPLTNLSRSKRMIISGVVFLLLVFVVYKMIMPSQETPATDISQTTAQAVPAAPVQALTPPPVAQQPPVTVVQSPGAAIPTNVTTAPVAQQIPASMPQPTQVMNAPQSMPGVIPVQSSASYNMTQPLSPVLENQVPGGTAAAMNNLSVESQRVMAQLQADYTQKIAEVSASTRAVQEQMQALNARVATMESQLSQLVQALTQQQIAPPAPVTVAPPPPVIPSPPITDAKAPYNVQAIIPGRAWLRSDSGETVTVAEGDTIRDLGRVTKIDPYDGVVEVNTGSKVVSLSYGSGG